MAITKVTNSLVATNAIQGTLIADNAITSVHIAQNQVTAVQIPDGSITSTQIAANSIDTAELVTGSIDTIHIGDSQVTTAKITDLNVTTGKIANNAITAAKIPDGSITATQLDSSTAPTFGNITTTGSLRGPASFTIDPAAVGDNTGTVVIAGSLQVDGTTTTVNSTTLSVADKNIVIASGAADAAAANDAGLTVTGASATLLYKSSGDKWSFNKPLDITGNSTATNQIATTSVYSNNGVYYGASTLDLKDSTSASFLSFASNKNATFAGTISSGAITSSGYGVFTNGNIDPDSFTSYAGGIGNISDGSGWGARGLFVHGGGTGDAAAIAHNGNNLYFGIQNGSATNSMATWMEVTPARVVSMSDAASVTLPNTTAGTISSGAITSSGNLLVNGIAAVNKTAVASAVALTINSDASTTSSYGLEVCNATSNTRFLVDGVGNTTFYGSNNAVTARFTSDNLFRIGASGGTGQRLSINGHAQSDTMSEANAWLVAQANGGDGIAIGTKQTSPYATWIQSGYLDTLGTSNHYALALNPHGGNVGIGTSSPDSALHVHDVGALLSSDSYFVAQIQTDRNDDGSNDDGILQFVNGSSKTVKGEIRFDESTNTFELGHGDNQDHLVIASGGNVGIGDTSPMSRLQVGTPNSATASHYGRAEYTGLNLTIPNTVGAINQLIFSNAAAESYGYGGIGMVMTSGSGVGLADMVFTTKESGSNVVSTERMRISSAGNVGINKSPGAGEGTLQVSGAKSYVSGTLSNMLQVEDSTSAAAGVGGGIQFTGSYTGSTKTTGGSIEAWKSNGSGGNYAFDMVFKTRDNGAGSVERARFGADGGDPSYGRLRLTSSYGALEIGAANASYFHFQRNTGPSLFYFSNACQASGGFSTYSDERLKENIVTITGALDSVAKMNGVTFKWKDPETRGGNNTGKQFGVTAQNMLEVDSELPTLNVDPLEEQNNIDDSSKDTDYYSMDYSRITPFLIEAVKELKTKLEAAEARITELEG